MTQQPGSRWSGIIQYTVEMYWLKGVKKVVSSILSWKKTRSSAQRTWLLQIYHKIVMMAISTSYIFFKAGQSLCIVSPGIYVAQCPVPGCSQSEWLGEKYPTEQNILWCFPKYFLSLQHFSVKESSKQEDSDIVLNSSRSLLFHELVPISLEPRSIFSIFIFCSKACKIKSLMNVVFAFSCWFLSEVPKLFFWWTI